MVALEHAIQAARDIGKEVEAERWGILLEGFNESFRAAAGRDMREDSLGNRFLPITVAETDLTIPPQRGQYAFLLPLPYGNFFYAPDTIMHAILRGNLAMLDAYCAEGLILGSGWLHDGVWAWLGNVHSMAHLLTGNSAEAWKILSAVADHACPLATWIEEQQLRTAGKRTTGDGSNAEASALFVQALASLLVLERPDGLIFCAGIPGSWLRPESVISVDSLVTRWGQVSLVLQMSSDGNTLTLDIRTARSHTPGGMTKIDLAAFIRAGFRFADGTLLPAAVDLPVGSKYQRTLKRR
jgi:hypothetical protein